MSLIKKAVEEVLKKHGLKNNLKKSTKPPKFKSRS